jgi:flagellar biosynthesis/type III secretory pathway M-ring protein FliF/YscJ
MSLALLLANLIPALLSNIPGISDSIKRLIGVGAQTVAVIVNSGIADHLTANSVLSVWAGIITAMKSDPDLSPTTLGQIAEIEKAVHAAVTEDAEAAKQVDWTKINPIATV